MKTKDLKLLFQSVREGKLTYYEAMNILTRKLKTICWLFLLGKLPLLFCHVKLLLGKYVKPAC